MRNIVLIAISIFVLAGCMPAKKKPVMVNQDSAAAQQARAAQADAEMDRDIAAGEPTLTMPKPAMKPKPKPAFPKSKSKLMSLKPKTKYSLKNGYPEWFYSSVYDGYIGAVGIAKKQLRGGYSAQKRVARMQAQKNLAKQINVLVKSEVNVETLGVDTATVQYYRQKVTSLTREQVDQFLTGFKVMDEWYDDKNEELYLWMVLRK
jgi:hypothetical protein